jgi:autotransporter-associated beta strand protein
LDSSVVTNNGTILFVRQDNGVFSYGGPIVGTGKLVKDVNNFNPGDVTLTASNSYTGGTIIGGGELIIDNGSGGGWITGNVIFTNSTQVPNDDYRSIVFLRPDNVTFPGNITGPGAIGSVGASVANAGQLVQGGTGVLTVTGTNTYLGGTVISNGVLQVGAGGASGSIGSGPVTDLGVLVFDRSDNVTITNTLNGTGQVAQASSGTLTLSGLVALLQTSYITNTDNSTFTNYVTNIFVGTLTASNGTLVVTGGSVSNNVTVEGGTFAPASLSAGGSLLVFSNLEVDAGTVLVPLNKSLLPQTNITVQGTLTYTGGALVVTNVGPALVAGDKFHIFSQAVSGFGTVTGAGATWQNNLGTDGTITALTVPNTLNPNSPTLQFSVSGNTLKLGWPTNLGWILQTNSSGLAATSQWFPYPGSTTITNVSITINPAKTNVFFRMMHP